MSGSNVWQWFAAALVHDLGKTVLDASGQWTDHELLDKKPFGSRLPATIVDKAKIHGDLQGLRAGSYPPEAVALIMADGFQQAMAQATERPPELQQHPAFYPYYGTSEPGYDQHKVQPLVSRIAATLSKSPSLKSPLELKKVLTHSR